MSTENQPQYSVAWWELVQMFVRCFGQPLPLELMEIGDLDTGWYAKFDRKDKPATGENPIMVYHNCWPSGVLDYRGGALIGVVETDLIEWAKAEAK